MGEGNFVEPPDPGRAGDLAELVEQLRLLKVWAGDPSYEEIKNRVNERWRAAGRPVAELARRTTVLDCFRPSRRRLNTDLVTAVVHALHPDHGYVAQWRQALRVIGGEVEAAAQVRIHSALPADPTGFTGRDDQLAAARELLDTAERGAVLLVEGMAGVGKTHLVTRLAHKLRAERAFDQVLFVDLRGHHPDPAQPPADPAAVLDGFLRVLGVPGRTVPHETAALSAAFKAATASTPVLVVLDNATSGEQVAALLPDGPGCVTLVTSRRRLTGLPGSLSPAACLLIDVFAPAEALEFLALAAPGIPVGADPEAPARIARSCGHLPLALGLIAGQMRRRTGWTLTEHADRLEERRRVRQLESAVETAFDLSYRLLDARHQRLLRLFAVQPAQDLDAFGVAALTGIATKTAYADLADLADEHVLQRTTADRYTCHDLVRVFAAARAVDEDPPSARRDALARLVDYHLGATAVAMDRLYPAEAHRRPRVDPPGTDVPDLADPLTARAWLDGERAALVDVAVHAAVHGQAERTARLSALLFRYLDGGHHLDALAVHGHACRSDDPAQRAHALTNLGTAHLQLGRYDEATGHFEQALELFTRNGDRVGQARALGNLGLVAERVGRYELATRHLERVLGLFRAIGDRTGEAHTLTNLGVVEERRGRLEQALDHHQQALELFRRSTDLVGEAHARTNLADVHTRLGRYGAAADHLHLVLALARTLGNDDAEARVFNSLGLLHTHADEPGEAARMHRSALAIAEQNRDQQAQAWAHNGLGEALRGLDRPSDALTHHRAAHSVAVAIGAVDQHARAHTGLGAAHEALGDITAARRHHGHARLLYRQIGVPEPRQSSAGEHRSDSVGITPAARTWIEAEFATDRRSTADRAPDDNGGIGSDEAADSHARGHDRGTRHRDHPGGARNAHL